MTNNENKNKPVYQYLGFKLIEASYYREDRDLDWFSVKVLEGKLTNNTYNLVIQIQLKFDNLETVSHFLFQSGFIINNMNWFEQLSAEQLNSIFTSVTFPYFREKIYSFTNDNRGSIELPIIDLRDIDLTKGLVLQKIKNN